MGFSGGGSGVLKNHQHDGTVTQDGGALNMDNVTQASLTAGDLVYSDGSHLQRLAIGGSGQSLTSSGTAPQWSAAGGAAVDLVHFESLAVQGLSFSVSFSAVTCSSVAGLKLIFNGMIDSTAEVYCRINNITTASSYRIQRNITSAGSGSNSTSLDDAWNLNGFMSDDVYIVMDFNGGGVSDDLKMVGCIVSNSGEKNSFMTGQINTGSVTTISEVEFYVTGTHHIKAGSTIGIYKYNN